MQSTHLCSFSHVPQPGQFPLNISPAPEAPVAQQISRGDDRKEGNLFFLDAFLTLS